MFLTVSSLQVGRKNSQDQITKRRPNLRLTSIESPKLVSWEPKKFLKLVKKFNYILPFWTELTVNKAHR